MKMTCWTILSNPFTIIGPVSTELDCGIPIQVDHALSVVEMRSPIGDFFVFDASTGLLLGRKTERVINDLVAFKDQHMDKAYEKLAAIRTDLIQHRERATKVERWDFWKLLHAA